MTKKLCVINNNRVIHICIHIYKYIYIGIKQSYKFFFMFLKRCILVCFIVFKGLVDN